MRRFVLALLALFLLRADMYPDASNAALPAAQENLKITPLSALALGFKNDGVTDNTAAMTALFARTDSPVVYFPAGIYNMACPTATITTYYPTSLIGAGDGSTIIKYPPGCTIATHMFMWYGNISGVRVSGLTIDLNTPVSGSTPLNVLYLAAHNNNVNGGSLDHLKIVNGAKNMYLIYAEAANGSLQNFHIDDNYLHLTEPHHLTDNQCIGTSMQASGALVTKITVDRNICVNTGIQVDGTHSSVSFNDVSGYTFGTAIYSPYWSSSHLTIIGNRAHDSGLTRDSNSVLAGGIEAVNNSIICDNMFYNLGGTAINNFGKNSLICNNVAYNNSNSPLAGVGTPEQAAYHNVLLGPNKFGANTRWVGNRAWDDRGTPKQLYGYFDYKGDAVPGISLAANDFKGYGTGRAYAIAMDIAGNAFPNPVMLDSAAVMTVAQLPACEAATKHSVASVSDQSGVPTYRGALTGGGGTAVLAYCNGTSWEAH